MSNCQFFDGGSDAPVGNGIAHGFQRIIVTQFNGIFSLGMDQHGALLGLFFAMTADLNECFDHPFESVHFVIPHNEAERMDILHQYLHFLFFLWLAFRISKPVCHEHKNRTVLLERKLGRDDCSHRRIFNFLHTVIAGLSTLNRIELPTKLWSDPFIFRQ